MRQRYVKVAVNDKMQRGYRYVLTAPVGRNFDPDFSTRTYAEADARLRDILR